MKTHLPKVNLDQRKWHVVDADGAGNVLQAIARSDVSNDHFAIQQPHPPLTLNINVLVARITGGEGDRTRLPELFDTASEMNYFSDVPAAAISSPVKTPRSHAIRDGTTLHHIHLPRFSPSRSPASTNFEVW